MNVALRSKPNPALHGLSLCAGAGGLDLGIMLADPGYRAVAYVEQEARAAATLVARMEDQALHPAPVWDDIKSFDGRPWRGKVDIVSAGYPCQPFSTAGKQRGQDDPRHLWPHVARILRESGARRGFFENVEGHLNIGFDHVVRDLQGMGFSVAAGLFSAFEVGGAHIRRRLFILADADRQRMPGLSGRDADGGRPEIPEGPVPAIDGGAGNPMDGSDDDRVQPGRTAGEQPMEASGVPLFPPAPHQHQAWARCLDEHPGLQPALPRVADGMAGRLERARLIGNGVCPLAAAHAYRTLDAALSGIGNELYLAPSMS